MNLCCECITVNIKIGQKSPLEASLEETRGDEENMMGARTVKKVKRKLKTESVNYNVPTQNRFINLTNKTSEVSKPQPEKPKLPAAITITDDCAKADTVLAEIPCKFRRKIIGVGVKIFTDRAEDKATIMAKKEMLDSSHTQTLRRKYLKWSSKACRTWTQKLLKSSARTII